MFSAVHGGVQVQKCLFLARQHSFTSDIRYQENEALYVVILHSIRIFLSICATPTLARDADYKEPFEGQA